MLVYLLLLKLSDNTFLDSTLVPEATSTGTTGVILDDGKVNGDVGKLCSYYYWEISI